MATTDKNEDNVLQVETEIPTEIEKNHKMMNSVPHELMQKYENNNDGIIKIHDTSNDSSNNNESNFLPSTIDYNKNEQQIVPKLTIKLDRQSPSRMSKDLDEVEDEYDDDEDYDESQISQSRESSEASDDDPLVWKEGIGCLPLTDLKFRYNELGCLELDESSSGTNNQNLEKDCNNKTNPEAFNKEISVNESSKNINNNSINFMDSTTENSEDILDQDINFDKISDKKKRKIENTDDFQPVVGKKSRYFPWTSYLSNTNSQMSPISAFSKPYPTRKNHFKVGMMLEGIDPKRSSLYCVLQIAQVLGHRLRLNFYGFSNAYDFWVNADSPFIFPAGWCMENKKKIQNPPSSIGDFDWNTINQNKLAPSSIFVCANTPNNSAVPPYVTVGMKLEAVDKKNTVLTCVASINDIISDKVLIHFDGWESEYDYWCDLSSPYIHPIGWCQANAKALSPPPNWANIKAFTWEKFLKQTGSVPVPTRAFKNRSVNRFELNSKLEVVDFRNPSLIRVATIAKIEANRLLIHYDNWPEYLDTWVDDDSPDLHPCGYCSKTNHPLQPPPDLKESKTTSGCPTFGCTGIGHVKGASHQTHHSEFGCPYNPGNLSKDFVQDRLKPLIQNETHVNSGKKCPVEGCDSTGHVTGKYPFHHKISGCPVIAAQKESLSNMTSKKRGRKPLSTKTVSLTSHIQQTCDKTSAELEPVMKILSTKFQRKVLSNLVIADSDTLKKWSTDQVCKFIKSIPGCSECGRKFREEEIDGDALLLAKQQDFVDRMGIKLGPAIKIATALNLAKYDST